ncbi:MAG: helix-turn-helix domain-containing protein [Candidatus Anstonellales archaeon]
MARKPMFKTKYNLNDQRIYEIIQRFENENYIGTVNKLEELVQEYEEERRMYQDYSRDELYTVNDAYKYLRANGIDWEYNIFKGRLDRGSIPVIIGDDGNKYILKSVLDNIIDFHNEVYSLHEAYEKIRKVNPRLTLRAFIGRIEKEKLPVIIVYRKRFLPKQLIDDLVYIYSNYVEVSHALSIYRENGLNISRNTLERRLDRGILPFIKLGKKRLIPKDVLMKSIEEERRLKFNL